MKLIKLLYVIFIFTNYSVLSQTTVKGVIIDGATKKGIPFTSLGIIGKNIGNLSDEEGNFEITLSNNLKFDSIKIFSIGYKPLTYLVSDFFKETTKTLELINLPTQLEEIVVKSKKVKFKTLGISDYTKNNCTGFADIEGNWKGAEAAILVRNKKNVLMENFSFYVIQNKYSDSLRFRLNLYERIAPPKDAPKWVGEDWVGRTILKKAIIFKVGIKQGEFTLPIREYNIHTDKDFFISLECLMDEMEITKFCYSSGVKTPSFFKVKAFSKWHRTTGNGGRPGGGGGDFNVKVSYTD
jgi:hypothetical protein